MSIKCNICQQEFKKLIPWRHLKTHNLTTSEYKELYGKHSLASEEYRFDRSINNSGDNNPNYGNTMSQKSRTKISEANKKKTPHNKGKQMAEEQKEILKKKAISRNKLWKETNSHPLKGKTHSEETKQKIREKRKLQKISNESVQKALITKKEKGYDLAFFKGKKHSEETKQKISDASRRHLEEKSKKSLNLAIKRLSEYDYRPVYVDKHLLVIKCVACGTEFVRSRQYASAGKITNDMCPTCFPKQYKTSKQEKELANFIATLAKIETNNRTLLNPKEIDISVPDHNIAFEYNGLYWHSELYRDSKYHINKTKAAENKGIQLIQIFEDEWVNNKDIVKSRIASLLKKSQYKLYARKCVVSKIDSKIANKFIKLNHLQGVGRSNVCLGLYHDNQLVSVMTFLQGDISKKISGWELNRFCSLINYNVVGAAGKLFSYFTKNFNPDHIISFSDRRWSNTQSVYNNLGFVKVHDSPPNYWYFLPNELHRYHRFGLRKPKKSMLTEIQLRHNEGYLRIYDCGSTKWKWSRKKGEE